MRMKYLGPGQAGSMTLKRAFVDLDKVKRECRPGGPEYARLEALLAEIDATHLALFKRPAREPVAMHVCGVKQTAGNEKTPPPGEGDGA